MRSAASSQSRGTGRDQLAEPAEPACLERQHGVVEGVLAERGVLTLWTEAGRRDGRQGGVEPLKLQDGVFQLDAAFFLTVVSGFRCDGENAALFGFESLA